MQLLNHAFTTHQRYYRIIELLDYLITPRACARGKVIGFVVVVIVSVVVIIVVVVVVSTKIARSQKVGV